VTSPLKFVWVPIQLGDFNDCHGARQSFRARIGTLCPAGFWQGQNAEYPYWSSWIFTPFPLIAQ